MNVFHLAYTVTDLDSARSYSMVNFWDAKRVEAQTPGLTLIFLVISYRCI